VREIGFPWSEAMAERARRSVGATIAGVPRGDAEGVAPTWPAARTMPMPTRQRVCVFNDAAVAAR
jgi:acetoin utilization deacetylase AcuC-like enzyme